MKDSGGAFCCEEADFFNELGMEPEYRAPRPGSRRCKSASFPLRFVLVPPRVLEKEHPKGSSVSSLLDEPAEVS